MTEFNRLEFIESQRPKTPSKDWRVISLFVPSCFSALAFLIFTTLGYSFTEFEAIPDVVRFWLVIVAAIALGVGSEVGTLFSTIEIGRKQKLKEDNVWDWVAMGFSLATTLAGFVLALATLLGEFASWGEPVQIWGSIFCGLLAAIDAYFGFWETGYLFANYEKRVESWFLRMEKEQGREMSTSLPVDIQDTIKGLQSKMEQLQYPPAELQWFKTRIAGLNGSLSKYQKMTAYQAVQAICLDGGKRFDKTERTAATWFEFVKGKVE